MPADYCHAAPAPALIDVIVVASLPGRSERHVYRLERSDVFSLVHWSQKGVRRMDSAGLLPVPSQALTRAKRGKQQ
jgi:hypothetical protein